MNVPSFRAEIDQQKALSYGVALENISSALSNTFGNGFVNFFSYQNRNFQVYLQNEDEFRKTPEDINNVYVRGGNGERIPLSEFVTLERQVGPSVVSRFGVYIGAQFQGGAAPGYSSAQAIAAMEEVVLETLGPNWGMGWTGTAYQESNLGNTATLAIARVINQADNQDPPVASLLSPSLTVTSCLPDPDHSRSWSAGEQRTRGAPGPRP